jgi:simple sugar transport system substrate-binding protein/D-xylose transport system substrate-binding protein
VKTAFRWTGGLAAAATIAIGVAACGGSSDSGSKSTSGSSGGGGASGKVAFLMPDQASTRYEKQDHPFFEAKLKQLCPKCSVIYQNADADPSKQQQQATSAITQGVKVMVVDPVDAASMESTVNQAKTRGIKVVAYDRPFPKFKVDFYVSFDNEKIGKLISTSLMDHLKQTGAASKGGILQVNGSPTDAAAGLIKKGVHEGVSPSGVKELAEFDTPQWLPAKAQDWVSGQISRFKNQIVGVVAANDGTGGGAISAFKAAGVKPVPPGRDPADRQRRPVQHHQQADQDRGVGRRRGRELAAPGQAAQDHGDRVQHPVGALHAVRRHEGQRQEADDRLGPDEGLRRLHRGLRQGLRRPRDQVEPRA